VEPGDRLQIERDVNAHLVREILEAVCRRDRISLESEIASGEPAPNYELALRLGIGAVFGV
jgi:hypothetical protein